uniref:Uncharacterized protein n=1 Tax=Rhizophora mucronata TaxID=61149 RepID=A0A2P2IIH5_RHIMU
MFILYLEMLQLRGGTKSKLMVRGLGEGYLS